MQGVTASGKCDYNILDTVKNNDDRKEELIAEIRR